MILVWATSVELLNSYLQKVRGYPLTSEVEWIKQLPDVPLPTHMGFTLVALLILAAAATFYKLFCPVEIQESSETRWVCELRQPTITYRSLTYSRIVRRWVTAICYVVGGPWVCILLVCRVFETFAVLF